MMKTFDLRSLRSIEKRSLKGLVPFSDDSAIEVKKKGYVPENTKESTSWAVGVFSE